MQRILIVDDDAGVRHCIALILGKSGFSIETAQDGPEALARFAVEQFDLVLTDMKMPGMSGLELARRLKSTKAAVKIILITAFQPEGAGGLFEAVILKPFSVRELQNSVFAALAFSRPTVPGRN